MYSQKQAKKDKIQFLQEAEKYELAGEYEKAGLLRVEASNCDARVGMIKYHKPNLGPYTASNPMLCMHCGLSGDKWDKAEECK